VLGSFNLTSIGAWLGAGLLAMSLALVPAGNTATAATQKKTNKAAGAAQGKNAKAAKPSKAGQSAKPGKSQLAASKRSLAKGKGVRGRSVVRVEPPRPSMGQLTGLHLIEDPLELKSAVALVIDQDTNEVLVSKNPQAVLPIASITKLMTAVVVADAKLPMNEMLEVSAIDVMDTGKTSRSRLKVGAQLSRGEMMHLALMASENRAAYALGRYYPGGMNAFVAAMNRKAVELGMTDTRYVEPTGLSSQNRSSARDLSVLVKTAMAYPQIRELSTSQDAMVSVGDKQVQFRNTNGLVRNPSWEIGVQKTGYISEAGRCLVMQASLAGRKLIMVLLDSAGRYSRMGDAERIRNWLTESHLVPAVIAAPKN
jgi:serine-type D-Ala-D-Ala endopeptidase (penicillin-binding protein 7)